MPTTIKEALALDDGMPVTGLTGTVKAAYDAKSGGEGDRAWRFIPLVVTDNNGAEIRVTWFSPTVESPKDAKGRPVEISAKKNQKNQLSGAKIQHRDYKGKPQVQITVDGAHLRFTDEAAPEATSAPQAASATQGGQPAYSPVVSGGKAAPGPVGRPTDIDLIAAVGRWTKGLREALDPAHPDVVPVEVIQPLLSTFLIAATSDRSSLTIVPPGHLPEHVKAKAEEKVDTRGENLDPLDGALDGYDDPVSESQDLDWT